ncbi:putative sulfate transporter 3.5 isoform X1 [Cinnamomum micranthum f. kanehirae]|uniref:Putative sulfate transporter 3.5 isoform X1 n=1 Tax=Cinnamomum micranthum f. kanehirae TaxID=337451 RepID=A0A3S3M5N4_9MAGN|nr:putative sulfate transporter 3.5 isoform X1 [Cinnamomum micranthum f. kanehirae]
MEEGGSSSIDDAGPSSCTRVNLSRSRNFSTIFISSLKETLFPDDPFSQFQEQTPLNKFVSTLKYYVPMLEWLPNYSLKLFKFDLLSGITIASLAIPQGISYAKLADLPPIIGLYSSFTPPLVYAVFGSSKDLAVGNVAAASLLAASIISEQVSAVDNPTLYLHLFYTATFFTGVFQLALGFFRLGILVDFLSRSTILGFMSGTAIIISLQQLKGLLGMTHFTTHTDVVAVMKAVFSRTDEWRWESVVLGVCCLCVLLTTQQIRKRNPKLFWVSAVSPMLIVVIGCLLSYFLHIEKHGIQIVGPLKKGLNPISIQKLEFDSAYVLTALKAGIFTGTLALAEGIAIGRSFGMTKNYQIDGNKEMIAFGLMNVVGSFTSCYLTTGPFSKSAVNSSSGCKTAMSNAVMSICLMLILLFLAPAFSYTPIVVLSAIIITAMIGLIEYKQVYHLFKVDKFDFCICMAAFLGVVFASMDIGLMLSVGLSILKSTPVYG